MASKEERLHLIEKKGLYAPSPVTLEGTFGPGDDGRDVVCGSSEDGFVITRQHGRIDPARVHRA